MVVTPTGQLFLNSEIVLPKPIAIYLVIAATADGPQTHERTGAGGEPDPQKAHAFRRENPEWRHVTQGACQNRQQQENIRCRHQARIVAHFVERNRPQRYQ